MADTNFSKRVGRIDTSGIRRVFDLAQQIKNPCNLSIGQPDFPADPDLAKAAINAIENNLNGYSQTDGIADLRKRVSDKYNLQECPDWDTLITSGVSGGLCLSFACLLDEGDELLISDPYFCLYRDLSFLYGANLSYFDTYPDFRIRISELEKAVTDKTRAIVINSPSNPTGACITEEELSQIIDFARSRDLWLIYDEIYSDFNFDRPHVEALGKYDKLLILSGLSKSHGVTGWRLGYAVGPRPLIEQMKKVQQYTFVCAPTPLQHGALEYELVLSN